MTKPSIDANGVLQGFEPPKYMAHLTFLDEANHIPFEDIEKLMNIKYPPGFANTPLGTADKQHTMYVDKYVYEWLESEKPKEKWIGSGE